MSKSRRGAVMATGIALAAIIAGVAVLSWNAGGPQEMREITQPIALPELPE